jgi:2-methylaconitate cis-trans-isomerase PrpF
MTALANAAQELKRFEAPKGFLTFRQLVCFRVHRALQPYQRLGIAAATYSRDTQQECSNAQGITMATKKTSRTVRLYVEAHQRAYAWADKAMVYRHAGKIAQATAATQKARRWLRKWT